MHVLIQHSVDDRMHSNDLSLKGVLTTRDFGINNMIRVYGRGLPP